MKKMYLYFICLFYVKFNVAVTENIMCIDHVDHNIDSQKNDIMSFTKGSVHSLKENYNSDFQPMRFIMAILEYLKAFIDEWEKQELVIKKPSFSSEISVKKENMTCEKVSVLEPEVIPNIGLNLENKKADMLCLACVEVEPKLAPLLSVVEEKTEDSVPVAYPLVLEKEFPIKPCKEDQSKPVLVKKIKIMKSSCYVDESLLSSVNWNEHDVSHFAQYEDRYSTFGFQDLICKKESYKGILFLSFSLGGSTRCKNSLFNTSLSFKNNMRNVNYLSGNSIKLCDFSKINFISEDPRGLYFHDIWNFDEGIAEKYFLWRRSKETLCPGVLGILDKWFSYMDIC